jgi:hypothetical protein
MGVLRIENAWAEDGPLDLRLPAPGAVRGTIRTEPGGRPLAGARVILSPLTVAPFLEPREATTDEKGRWRVSGLPRAGYRVEVLAEGHLQVRPLEVVPRPGEELPDVDLTLRPLGALEGKVATKGTDAIAGARVYLRYPRSEEWFTVPDPRAPLAITDAKGSFLIERLPPEVRVRMAVVADGFAPAVLDDVAVAGGAPTKLAPVFLEKGAVLRGRVLAAGEGEAPIAGATVMAVPLDEDPRGTLGGGGDGWRARRARTGEDGRFRIEGLRAGTYRLAAVRDDRRPVVSGAVEASVDEKKAAEHVLRLPEGARLDGTVRDAEDRPVVGALVEVAEEPGGTRFRRTTSAADGSFSFAGLAPGRFIVSASAEGLAPARREGVLAGRPVAIVLMAPGAVSGTVTAGPEDEGVPPFSLAALRREERDPGEPGRARYVPVFFGRFRAAGGAFRAELPAGIYRLEVEVAGGRAGSVEGVEVRAGRPTVGVIVPTAASGGIRGRVVDGPDGGGAEGAVVSLLSPGSDAARTSVVADGNGEFRLDGVPVGMATIVVEGRDRAPVRVGGIRIHEGLVSSIDDVVLDRGAVLRVQVRGTTSHPLAGVTLSLERVEHGTRREQVTDADGVAIFDLLEGGSYRLWRERGDGGLTSWVVRLDDGEVTELLVNLARGVRLEGTVRRGEAPVAGVRIEALRLPGDREPGLARSVHRTVSTEDGTYAFRELPPGEYLLRLQPAEAGSARVQLALGLPPAEVHRQDLELPREGLVVRVEDRDSGGPLGGAEIVVRTSPETRSERPLGRQVTEVLRGRTDAGGRLAVPGLAPGRYRVEARAPGHGQVGAVVVVPAGDAAVEVRLRAGRGGVLAGEILDLRQRPVPGTLLAVLDATGRPATRHPRVPVGADGRFRIEDLAPGTYRVEAEAPGHARDVRFGTVVLPDGETRLSLRLEEEGRLRVTVFGPGGLPVRGAEVAVTDAFGRPVWPPHEEADLYRVDGADRLTDARGEVVVPNLPAGIHLVRARAPGLLPFTTRVLVQTGVETRAAVVLSAE